MEAAPPRQLVPGTMLDDKYRIERLLAEGGMGAVYEGTHVRIRKRVAIKVINAQLATPPLIERFHREAITASQIGHEGIVQTTDLGTSKDGEPFLVMELLEGESLASRLKAHGRMPIDLACELGCAILSPLAAAHQAGIVHRDLKPDNVFLVRQSRGEMVKLLDFGISRAAGLDGDFRLTTTGLVLGTPFYMSPEQARGDTSISFPADLYAVGVILYEMLIGKVPIHAGNYNQLMYRVMTGEFEYPRKIRPEIPIELEQVILRAMSLDPANRQASAAALEHELLAFCRPTYREHMIERISMSAPFMRPTPVPEPTRPSRPSSITGHEYTVAQNPTPPPVTAAAAPARRGKGLLIAAVLVVLAGVGVAVAVGMGASSSDKPVETASTTHDADPPKADPPSTPSADPPKADPPSITPSGDPPKVDPPTTQPTTQPAVEPAPTTITLRFSVQPKTAKVHVDGKPVTKGELVVPKDAAKHTVSVAAPGFITQTEEITFEETQRLAYDLVRVGKPNKPRQNTGPGRQTKPDRIDPDSPYK